MRADPLSDRRGPSSRHFEPPPRGLLLPTVIIGIGLSGFFDGILLHQVLQWHHLLSLVPGETVQDIGTQILADGLFHVLMYLITAAGLWMLWRRRASLASAGLGWRHVAGGGLLGFGLWNVIDVSFFHWILGIHRIRVNVPDPMLYDLGWIAALGILPLGLGRVLLRSGPGKRKGGGAAVASLAALALVGAGWAARPPRGSNTALVFFVPGTSPGDAVNAVLDADAPLLWADPRGRVIAVALDDPDTEARLARSGALFVTRSPILAGCAAALQA